MGKARRKVIKDFVILGIGLSYLGVLISINHRLKKLFMKQEELVSELNKVTVNLQKVGNESAALVQKVADLEAAIGSQSDVSPDVVTALEAVKAQAKVVDDMVPDAEETPQTGEVIPGGEVGGDNAQPNPPLGQ